MSGNQSAARREDRIDISWEYALCAWARHFNASEQRVKEAVQAVGNSAERVREHLAATGRAGPSRPPGERPSGR
jgi:hypothetical protein